MTLKDTPHGKEILAKAAGPDFDIVIEPGSDGPQADIQSQRITLDENDPLGIGPDNDNPPHPVELEVLVSIPVLGAPAVLAHELGHALGESDEINTVINYENPVRQDLGLPDRTTYHGAPILP